MRVAGRTKAGVALATAGILLLGGAVLSLAGGMGPGAILRVAALAGSCVAALGVAVLLCDFALGWFFDLRAEYRSVLRRMRSPGRPKERAQAMGEVISAERDGRRTVIGAAFLACGVLLAGFALGAACLLAHSAPGEVPLEVALFGAAYGGWPLTAMFWSAAGMMAAGALMLLAQWKAAGKKSAGDVARDILRSLGLAVDEDGFEEIYEEPDDEEDA